MALIYSWIGNEYAMLKPSKGFCGTP